MQNIDKHIRKGRSLDKFHDDYVLPTREERRGEGMVINEFVRFLQKEFKHDDHTVARVVKSGSLGKGTAVRGHADIDLVVIFNGITKMQDFKKTRGKLISQIKDKVARFKPWKGKVKKVKSTRFSVTYKLDGQKLDILPAYDILSVQETPAQIYRNIESNTDTDEAALHYSACLAPLQLDFVKGRVYSDNEDEDEDEDSDEEEEEYYDEEDNYDDDDEDHYDDDEDNYDEDEQDYEDDEDDEEYEDDEEEDEDDDEDDDEGVSESVKRVIRLIKYWKKQKKLTIRSYSLELVTIFASRELDEEDTDTLFEKVLELLSDPDSLEVVFDDNYDIYDYGGPPSTPYVLDPANPFMNTVKDTDMDEVSNSAAHTLDLLRRH